MNAPQSNDPLSRVLKEWRVAPPRTAEFRTDVWVRIGARKEAESWIGYLRGHIAVVAGALALAVVVGAVGGRSQARALAAAESARLASAYVQGMDARAIVMR